MSGDGPGVPAAEDGSGPVALAPRTASALGSLLRILRGSQRLLDQAAARAERRAVSSLLADATVRRRRTVTELSAWLSFASATPAAPGRDEEGDGERGARTGGAGETAALLAVDRRERAIERAYRRALAAIGDRRARSALDAQLLELLAFRARVRGLLLARLAGR